MPPGGEALPPVPIDPLVWPRLRLRRHQPTRPRPRTATGNASPRGWIGLPDHPGFRAAGEINPGRFHYARPTAAQHRGPARLGRLPPARHHTVLGQQVQAEAGSRVRRTPDHRLHAGQLRPRLLRRQRHRAGRHAGEPSAGAVCRHQRPNPGGVGLRGVRQPVTPHQLGDRRSASSPTSIARSVA